MISICICTMGRPEILRRCLVSIYAGELLPDEIIVSDDGCEANVVQALCQEFRRVHYVRGPQRGLCANRNVAVAACSGDYVALVDDDAIVAADFLRLALEIASRSGPKTILTGDVLEYGDCLTPPTNPSFWGHFGQSPHGCLKTIHLNCNFFPRSAFEVARFDEAITYGYEDMDLCAHLLARGYEISYHPILVNQHVPPHKEGNLLNLQRRQAEQARYYTSLKRYWLWQREPLKALAYMLLAPLHQAVHHLRRREFALLWGGFSEMGWAVRTVFAPHSAPSKN